MEANKPSMYSWVDREDVPAKLVSMPPEMDIEPLVDIPNELSL